MAVWTNARINETVSFDGCVLGSDLRCAPGTGVTTATDIAAGPPDQPDGGLPASDDVQAPSLA
jgi:hypothetical protein